MIYFGILKTLNSYTYCVLIQKHNYTITNTKSKVTTTKLCQVLVASLVSMVKVEEFMETYVRDSKYEGSYKADCSLTTDRNITPVTEATRILYKGTTLIRPDFIMKKYPISQSFCRSQLELTYQ